MFFSMYRSVKSRRGGGEERLFRKNGKKSLVIFIVEYGNGCDHFFDEFETESFQGQKREEII